ARSSPSGRSGAANGASDASASRARSVRSAAEPRRPAMSSARPKAASDAARGAAGARILLIDDDKRLADMAGRYLFQNGLEVTHCKDAASGLSLLRAAGAGLPALILLDLMLPDADGLDVCRDIRAPGFPAAHVPILMLTARGETTDRVVGLELGADDYLPKPFEPRELLARVRALLRRARPA